MIGDKQERERHYSVSKLQQNLAVQRFKSGTEQGETPDFFHPHRHTHTHTHTHTQNTLTRDTHSSLFCKSKSNLSL